MPASNTERGAKPGQKQRRSLLSKVRSYYQRRSASLVFKRNLAIDLEQPLISFTFDDFPRSALLNGGAILNRFGLAGTYYVSLGLAGQTQPSGSMFLTSDLSSLLAEGHELGCHTFSHNDSWDTDSETFEASVGQNRAELQQLLPGAEFRSFSYPISLPRPKTKARIAKYFDSCRAGGQTLNARKGDLNQLSAFFLEMSRDNIEVIKKLIDRNREERGWLIFATHDVSEHPTPFGCTPDFFEQVVEYAVGSGARILPVSNAVREIRGKQRVSPAIGVGTPAVSATRDSKAPLVSILIPAYNSQEWIADTLRSALAQTWERKEIVVVDDGSTDQTLAIARTFESDIVKVVSQKNAGASAARNTAFSLCHGQYIQWLDADDLLAPDKIALQMAAIGENVNPRILLSSAYGKFMYRWYRAAFKNTSLWADQSPKEWLLRKMGENLSMQTATWLVSRELTEAAGPWDTRLQVDDDGEYFCRILLASDGVRFVRDAKVYYRVFGYDSLSYMGRSLGKTEALWCSMHLHINYLRSLEDSPRSRAACIAYIKRNLLYFYPDRLDLVQKAEQVAAELGGRLGGPGLSWKYRSAKALIGWRMAKELLLSWRRTLRTVQKHWDKTFFRIETRNRAPLVSASPGATSCPQPVGEHLSHRL